MNSATYVSTASTFAPTAGRPGRSPNREHSHPANPGSDFDVAVRARENGIPSADGARAAMSALSRVAGPGPTPHTNAPTSVDASGAVTSGSTSLAARTASSGGVWHAKGSTAGGDMRQTCCDSVHPFDSCRVAQVWWPEQLRCLIIGESPGPPGAAYFYNPIPEARRDPVAVRRHLLAGFTSAGLIDAPTLEAFQDAGFLFDHAIRCNLSTNIIKEERRLAKHYRSRRAEAAGHLRLLLDQFPAVWAMGLIARNAVVHLYSLAPIECHLNPPYVIEGTPNFFVSAYFRRFDAPESIQATIERFQHFLAIREELEHNPPCGDATSAEAHWRRHQQRPAQGEERSRDATSGGPNNSPAETGTPGESRMDLDMLQEIEREFHERFPNEPTRRHQFLSDRIRRSLSWAKKSVTSRQDSPVQFVELWIAVNALYGQRQYDRTHDPNRTEAGDFRDFISSLVNLGARRDLMAAIREIRERARSVICSPFL